MKSLCNCQNAIQLSYFLTGSLLTAFHCMNLITSKHQYSVEMALLVLAGSQIPQREEAS